MRQSLFTELRTLYSGHNTMRFRIRMRDLIDPDAMRIAVDTTMSRYPYFCVQLTRGKDLYLAPNNRPVVITHSLSGVKLNAAESNYHLVSYSWFDNWIIIDISHAITDGTGAYEMVRTFLYYYISGRYGIELSGEGIRLAGDEISTEEWADPVRNRSDLPAPVHVNLSKALDLVEASGLEADRKPTAYSIAVPEDEFMRFNMENDGSPATMVSLFLCRAIHRVHPDRKDPIRIVMPVNQRNILNAPLAHQNLLGSIILEYKAMMQDWPLDRQATAFRGMVFAQSTEEAILAGVAAQNETSRLILSKTTDQERAAAANKSVKQTGNTLTGSVSYVGKMNYREAEKYIRDFRSWTRCTTGSILIEIAAVNRKFIVDFEQHFSNPVYMNAFLKELDEAGITYDLQDVLPLELPECEETFFENVSDHF